MFRIALGSMMLLIAHPASAQWDISGSLELEARIFPETAAYAEQDDATLSPSIAFQPEFVYEWDERSDRLTLELFGRLDAHDDRRTHFDIREANYLHLGDSWDVLVGISIVFWGVTESVHLVDIVNQTDGVEDIDGEDKLGQPMINLNLFRNSGTYSFFVLPGFRERTFPGDDARRRGPLPIDTSHATYESSHEQAHVDFAFRWYQTVGNWDVGLSHFSGTSREARFFPHIDPDGGVSFRPHYDLINQSGVEIQYTKNDWLWKVEGMSRWGHGDQFFATVSGFEYTLYQIIKSKADLGFLLEYQYDGRSKDGSAPISPNDNDIFAGARLTLNDEDSTAVLGGIVVDVKNGTTSGLLEAERRLNNSWKMELEARLFLHADDGDPVYVIRRDHSVNFRVTYSF